MKNSIKKNIARALLKSAKDYSQAKSGKSATKKEGNWARIKGLLDLVERSN